MSRPCSALLLLVALASPGTTLGQAPGPTAWTLAVGAYTIYGRTTYSPTTILRPRIVFDTLQGYGSRRG